MHSTLTTKRLHALDSLKQLLQQDNCPSDGSAPSCLAFITEQLKLVDVDKHARRYSPELIVFSYILLSVSPAALLA
ncbi:hypothetical protein BOX15_Mlig010049g1 [Macrostomum lignano]|uniref:Uncharacterized protein n=1 Tax=Macrostomum lignano TaxID=282301 RepID=A0A267GPL9_9PLAT|nr:hypothetical protein BOX15_Mlig010049g1 [Macrostomum lignano]